ncbi:MAG: hypothetical protein LBL07_09075 [Tannerella sp.]|jgi:hypothetical protein|nr:hypothetical protein [Tannerella sp.]
MSKFIYLPVFLLLFNSYYCHAQDQDTLKTKHIPVGEDEPKLTIETLDAIRKGTLIGPEPEQMKSKQHIDESVMKSLTGGSLKENLPDSIVSRQDSVSRLRVDKSALRRAGGLSKVMHRKTAVNDQKELANPHVELSFENILRSICWPSYRLKMKNRKQAKAYKTYND